MTDSTPSGVTKSGVKSCSVKAVGEAPTGATPGCAQPRLLAGPSGALTAALEAVGAAVLPGAVPPEEEERGEEKAEALGMPDPMEEAVVDVCAKCRTCDCR